MSKVFVLAPGEDWIVDRFVSEWNSDNSDISVSNPESAEVIWLLADWCWRQLPLEILKNKAVITTVHHIVPEKFLELDRRDFAARDTITDVYHVYNQRTLDFIRPFTSKPICLIPYWANQRIWRITGSKIEIRKKYGLPNDKYLIGSFQRDTEGRDLASPKLEKGPDLLCDFIERVSVKKNVHVVLAGWRRQYVISRLEKSNINYTYFERPEHEVVNDLYQALDLYPVTARCEGGPQALIECGLIGVPVVSRPVGIAQQILPPSAISDDVFNANPAVPNIESWKLPHGYKAFRELVQEMKT